MKYRAELFFVKTNKKPRIIIILIYITIAVLFAYSQKLFDTFYRTENSISLFLFSDVITEDVLKQFQKETGIKVNVKYCDADSEIWTQLYASEGGGYDVISPTDHIVERMKMDNLLQEIDASKVEGLSEVNPIFTNLRKSKKLYSVPFSWSFHGIGFQKAYFQNIGFGETPNSWKFIFEPYLFIESDSEKIHDLHLEKLIKKYQVCMIDEPMDILHIANLYFNGTTEDFSDENLKVLKEKLILQKPYIRAYTNANIGYYLTRVSNCVLAISAHMKIASKILENFGFLVPKEGSVMTVQHFSIPKHAKNLPQAYKFINYLLKSRCQEELFRQSGFLPTNQEALKNFYNVDPIATLGVDNLEKFKRINQSLSFEKAYEMMLVVKTQ